MSDTKTDIDELTTPQPMASGPAYEKWKERKISRAFANSKAHPEKRIPLHVIMKKFGLEAIYNYIAMDSPEVASRIISRILQSISILESFPLLGRVGKVEETREFSITGLPYFAVYTLPDETQIAILSPSSTQAANGERLKNKNP